jgi:hypothetical protein
MQGGQNLQGTVYVGTLWIAFDDSDFKLGKLR